MTAEHSNEMKTLTVSDDPKSRLLCSQVGRILPGLISARDNCIPSETIVHLCIVCGQINTELEIDSNVKGPEYILLEDVT